MGPMLWCDIVFFAAWFSACFRAHFSAQESAFRAATPASARCLLVAPKIAPVVADALETGGLALFAGCSFLGFDFGFACAFAFSLAFASASALRFFSASAAFFTAFLTFLSSPFAVSTRSGTDSQSDSNEIGRAHA